MIRKTQIKVAFGDVEYLTNARYDDSVSLSRSKGERFVLKAEELKGDIIFVRDDYELILSAPFHTRYEIIIEVDEGNGFTERYRTFFHRTDCEIDDDAETVSLSLESNTRYTKIEAAKGQVFDFLEVPPARTTVDYTVFSVVQVYIPGDSFLTNFNGSNYWEQPCQQNGGNSDLSLVYHFQACEPVFFVPGAGDLIPDIGGQYIYNPTTDGYDLGTYQFKRTSGVWNVHDTAAGDQIIYTGSNADEPFNMEFTASVQGSGSVAVFRQIKPFTRILTNAASVGGIPTELIPDVDFTDSKSQRFLRAARVAVDSFFVSDNRSETPTRYGQFNGDALHFAGDYFTTPTNGTAEQFFPLGKASWFDYSAWFYFDAAFEAELDESKETVRLFDAYRFSDVLKALLLKIDPTITHEATAEYSQFLYAANDFRGLKTITPVLVPVTNIAFGEYDQPATKAKISLNDIDSLIQNLWRCDWWIDENNRFRIEHLSFFENGGSYAEPFIVYDFTDLKEPKTGEPLEYGSRRYSFKKTVLPERIITKYGDRASELYEGFPITMTDEGTTTGKEEERRVDRITPDIDLAAVSGLDLNKEGLILLETEQGQEELFVPVVTFDYGLLGKANINNGYAAFAWAQENYHRHGMPVPNFNMNFAAQTALSTIKAKIQNIDLSRVTDYSTGLIKTSYGDAEIEEIDENLTTGNTVLKLLHDTE